MPLFVHLALHLSLALGAGYLVGRYFNRSWQGTIAGFVGGVLIDLDHVIDYWAEFGWRFNIWEFLQGGQYLASGQIHTWFHAWEYLPVLIAVAWLLRRHRTAAAVIAALAAGAFVHLVTDCLVNNYPPRNYSLAYRIGVDFRVESLLNEEQYRRYLEDRAW